VHALAIPKFLRAGTARHCGKSLRANLSLRRFAKLANWCILPLLLLLLPDAACAQFAFSTNNGALTITRYSGSVGSLIIPSSVYGLPVTAIGTNAFIFSYGLTNVTIPTSVSEIQSSGFALAFNLITINIPGSVTNIGISPFDSCHDLTAITVDTINPAYSSTDGVLFDKGTTTLIQYPGGKVGTYTIPDTVTNIQDVAFNLCPGLIGITIPNSVMRIGSSAFRSCTGLGNVSLPNSIRNVPEYAFADCYYMTNISIPGSVTNIGGAAFIACQHLANLVIPYGMISIGGDAFGGCYSLHSVSIPDTVTNIGPAAFALCTGLASIDVATNNPALSSKDGVMFDKGQTTLLQYPAGAAASYTIPNGVITIGDAAFLDCINLTNVIIPNSVTSIGTTAFDFCRLTNVSIPTSITNIGAWAFYGNPLTSITIPSSVSAIGSCAFQSCQILTEIYFTGNAPLMDSSVFYSDNAIVYYLPATSGWDSIDIGLPTMLWLPKIQTVGGDLGIRTNGFGFNINWASGMTVVVETSSALSNPDWVPISTNTLLGGTSVFNDPQWTNYPRRFYRIRSVY
jgi:hypothetical protein